MIKPIPKITAKQENFRIEQMPGSSFSTIRRDFIEPVPVGTLIAMVFRVTGYGRDCDGSALAHIAQVDIRGRETGWEENAIGLDQSSAAIVDDISDVLPQKRREIMNICAVRTLQSKVMKYGVFKPAQFLPHEPKSQQRFALPKHIIGAECADIRGYATGYAECKHCGSIYSETE